MGRAFPRKRLESALVSSTRAGRDGGTDDAVCLSVVIRPLHSLATVAALASAITACALSGCAKSSSIEPGDLDEGFGGRDAGGSESGGGDDDDPDGDGGAGGYGVGPGPGGEGASDGDDQSSASTGLPEVCGNDTCDIDNGETCTTCPGDCGACEEELCGDGVCDGTQGETSATCAEDCGGGPACGDDVCDEPEEDCDTCSEDCGVCMCEADAEEPNDNSPVATPLTDGVPLENLSICGTDVDWFRFTKNGTATITIVFDGAEGDIDMEIYDPDYVKGSYGNGDTEEVVLSAEPNGTYYARVYGAPAGQESWSYSVVVE